LHVNVIWDQILFCSGRDTAPFRALVLLLLYLDQFFSSCLIDVPEVLFL